MADSVPRLEYRCNVFRQLYRDRRITIPSQFSLHLLYIYTGTGAPPQILPHGGEKTAEQAEIIGLLTLTLIVSANLYGSKTMRL